MKLMATLPTQVFNLIDFTSVFPSFYVSPSQSEHLKFIFPPAQVAGSLQGKYSEEFPFVVALLASFESEQVFTFGVLLQETWKNSHTNVSSCFIWRRLGLLF